MMMIVAIFLSLFLKEEGWGKEPYEKAGTDKTHLTLKQAHEIALAHHPALKSSQFAFSSAKQEVKVAQANQLPQINLNAVRAFSDNTARLAAPPEGITNSLVLDRLAYGASATQLITDFGRTGYLVDSAKFEANASKAHILSTRDHILFNVTKAYYNVLKAEKLLQVAFKTQKTRALLFDQIKALLQSKLKSDLDLSVAHQSVEEADLLVLKGESFKEQMNADLSEALGYQVTKNFLLEDVKSVPLPPVSHTDLYRQARLTNPELAKLRAALAAVQMKYNAENAANYPTINAVGFAGTVPTRNKTLIDAHYATAGVNVSFPLYTGGRITAGENQARFQVRKVEQDLINKENHLTRDIRITWNQVHTAYKNINVTRNLFSTTTASLNLVQERYTVGLNSIVDLAQAQLAQTQAEISFTNAAYEYLIFKAFLDLLIGEKGGASFKEEENEKETVFCN